MKLRFPRDELAASMATVRNVEPTLAAIAAELTAEWAWHGDSVSAADLVLQPYGRNDAIGWDEHLLLRNGEPIAYTDGPVRP